MAEQANSIFVDQSEGVVATIGSNYLQNFLSGGNVGKGVGVLTQKRFYYKGRNFSGEGKGMTSTIEEGVVSIDDIAFTRFTYTRPVGLLIFAIVLTLAAAIYYFYIFNHGVWAFELTISAILLAATLSFYVMYFIKRHSLFLIAFPGGSFAFDIRYYPIADIRDFQRQLHLLKDHIKNA